MNEHAIERGRASRAAVDGAPAPRLERAGVAPVPARAQDVLAQPERGVLQLPAAADLPRLVRRDAPRRPATCSSDRPGHRGHGGDVDDVHRARLQHHRAARAGDPQAHARHAAADVGLPGRDRRQRGHQHGAADGDHLRRRELLFGLDWPQDLLVAGRSSSVLGVVCFAALGVALSHAIPNFDSAPAYVNAVFLPLIFISGVFYDAEDAPRVLQRRRPGAAAQAPDRRAVGRDGPRRGRRRPPRRRARPRRLGGRRAHARRARLLLGIAQRASRPRRPRRRGRRCSPARALVADADGAAAAEDDRAVRRAGHPGAPRSRAGVDCEPQPQASASPTPRRQPAARDAPQRARAAGREVAEVVAAGHVGGVARGGAGEPAVRASAVEAVARALPVDQAQDRAPQRRRGRARAGAAAAAVAVASGAAAAPERRQRRERRRGGTGRQPPGRRGRPPGTAATHVTERAAKRRFRARESNGPLPWVRLSAYVRPDGAAERPSPAPAAPSSF